MGLILDSSLPASNPVPTDLIKESDTANFAKDVMERSHEVPVIVDFWAPWCGPCKQLGPLLEKAVIAMGGAVRMVKIDVDENQDLAMQLQVQTVPTVFAFRDGQPVDGFTGALPESQIKAFIARLTGVKENPIDAALEQAKMLVEEGDHAGAVQIYSQVLAHDSSNGPAMEGVLRCYMALGETERVTTLLAQIPPELANLPGIKAVRTAMELAAESETGDEDSLLKKIAADPNDHQARYDLATAAFAAGKADQAVEQLLEILRRDRAWNDGAARIQVLRVLEAMGPGDPRAAKGRRALSTILFA